LGDKGIVNGKTSTYISYSNKKDQANAFGACSDVSDTFYHIRAQNHPMQMNYTLYVGHARPFVEISPQYDENMLGTYLPQVPTIPPSAQQWIHPRSSW
jgi:hypothetical protein